MKKVILLATLLTIFLLAGCSYQEKEPEKSVEPVKPKLNVAYIFPGSINDGGWVESHNIGRIYADKKLGIKSTYIENVPENSKVIDIVADLINHDDVNVVLGPSLGYQQYFTELSKTFPEVKFLVDSGGYFVKRSNMGVYFGNLEEGYYLAGMAAGAKTKTNKLGYVGAFPVPEIIRAVNAFELGAQRVNPKAKVYLKWTKTWYDPKIESQVAKKLIDAGCDVLGQTQNSPATQIEAEKNNVYSIGCYTDMSKYAPKANLTSAIWNWGIYYHDQLEKISKGTWKSQSIMGSISDGMIDIAPLTNLNSSKTKATIKKVKRDIETGKFNIFQGPLYDTSGKLKVKKGQIISESQQQDMNWYVKGVKVELID